MAKDNELIIKINGDVKGYRDALKATTKETEDLQKTINEIAKTGAVFFVAFAGAIALTTKKFADFDDGLRAVKTLLDESSFSTKTLDQGFQDLSKGALKTLSEFPLTLQSINKSLFDIVSAGIPAAKAVKVLGSTSRLAVAGITDSATATDAVTSALNAYGLSAEEAELVAAKFFTAQKFGKTTIEELGQFFGRAASSAAAYGISLDELLSATAAMTAGGIKTAAAMSAIPAILTNISNPTEKAADEAQRLGIEFNSTALRAKGLTGFLDELTTAQGFNKQSIEKLFGAIEAQKAVFSLTGAQAKKYKETLNELSNSQKVLTTFTEAYETQSKSLKNQMKILGNNFDALSISIGANLAPLMSALAKTTTGLLKFLQENPGLTKFIAKMLVAGTVTSGLITILALGATAFLKLRASMIAASLATKGLKFAVKGLIGSTGIGLLITFLPEIIDLFQSVFGGATDIVKRESDLQVEIIKDRNKILKAEHEGVSATEIIFLKNRLNRQRAFDKASLRAEQERGDKSIAEFKKQRDLEFENIELQFAKQLKAELAAVAQTEKVAEKVEKVRKESIDKKAQQLGDANKLLTADLEGIAKEEIAFLKRRLAIDQKEKDAAIIKDENRRKLSLENVRLLNQQLLKEEKDLAIKRAAIQSKKEKKEQEADQKEQELAKKKETRAAEKQRKEAERQAEDASQTEQRIKRLVDENEVISAKLDGQESEEVAFLQRKQALRIEDQAAENIANQEEKDLALENVRLKKDQLLGEEADFIEQKKQLKAEQAEIEATLLAELNQLSADERKSLTDTELEDLRKSIETKEKIRSKAIKAEGLERRKEQALFEKDEKKHGKTIAKIKALNRSESLKNVQSGLRALATLQQEGNSAFKTIGKAAAVTEITINTEKGALAALTAFQSIPFVGQALGIAAAAAVTLAGFRSAQRVQAAQDGGIVAGSGFGDRVPFMLEPGELITPRRNFNEVINAVVNQRIIEKESTDASPGVAEEAAPQEIIIGMQDDAADFLTVKQNEQTFLGISQATT